MKHKEAGQSAMISSVTNPRVKNVVKLRQRSHRDELGLMIIEGYREIRSALDNKHVLLSLFICPEMFLGNNDQTLVDRCRSAGVEILQCAPVVFEKMAYRDRPEGMLAIAPQVRRTLAEVDFGGAPLIVIAEAIEKPGNLGTILRSADAAGADCVIVCDRCTDINNPNVVRASIGTLFSLPVIEVSTNEALSWLKEHSVQILAATPHADKAYDQIDLTAGTAVVVGTEQYGLSAAWLTGADFKVSIPMLGQADSLNVAAATTILLYEAVRQRRCKFRQTD